MSSILPLKPIDVTRVATLEETIDVTLLTTPEVSNIMPESSTAALVVDPVICVLDPGA